MKYINVFLLIIISDANAQYDSPSLVPDIGWDRFKSMIVYPEIAKRAGIQGYVDVAINCDSIGDIGEIQVVGNQIFHQPIKDAIRKVTWNSNKKLSSRHFETVYFTIEFKLKPNEMPRRNVLRIEVDPPVVRKNIN
jgi:outer membrane biosynthesis protein TonB